MMQFDVQSFYGPIFHETESELIKSKLLASIEQGVLDVIQIFLLINSIEVWINFCCNDL